MHAAILTGNTVSDAFQSLAYHSFSDLVKVYRDSMRWCLMIRHMPAGAAIDAGAATTVNKLLCDGDCLAQLDAVETHETKSGLKYKDIVVGKGPSPPTGYQARCASAAA